MGIKMSLALQPHPDTGKVIKDPDIWLGLFYKKAFCFSIMFSSYSCHPKESRCIPALWNTVLVVTCSYIDPHPLCHPIAYLTTVPAWAGLTWTGDPCTKHRVPTGASHSVSVVGSVGLQPAELLGDCSPETAKSCQLVGALKGAPGRQQQQKCISIQTAWSATSC